MFPGLQSPQKIGMLMLGTITWSHPHRPIFQEKECGLVLLYSDVEKVRCWKEWSGRASVAVNPICLSLSLSHFLCIMTPLCIRSRGISDSCAVFSSRGITVAFPEELISQFVFWKDARSFARSRRYFACIITSLNRCISGSFFIDSLFKAFIIYVNTQQFHIIAWLAL